MRRSTCGPSRRFLHARTSGPALSNPASRHAPVYVAGPNRLPRYSKGKLRGVYHSRADCGLCLHPPLMRNQPASATAAVQAHTSARKRPRGTRGPRYIYVGHEFNTCSDSCSQTKRVPRMQHSQCRAKQRHSETRGRLEFWAPRALAAPVLRFWPRFLRIDSPFHWRPARPRPLGSAESRGWLECCNQRLRTPAGHRTACPHVRKCGQCFFRVKIQEVFKSVQSVDPTNSGSVAISKTRYGQEMARSTHAPLFCGRHFPDDVISLAVRWYLR
jgi:hypothetical protein